MSYRVVEAGEEHGQAILRLAREDPVLNAFLLYDWLVLRRERPAACDFHVALEEPWRARCALPPRPRPQG